MSDAGAKAFLCWLLLLLPAVAQEDLFVSQLWQVRDDLPHNHVRDVLQTRDGHIWLATPEGVARYNGVHFGIQFDRFHSGNTKAMPSNFCSVMAEDETGGLWLGLDTGDILRRGARGFTLLPSPEGWPRAPIVRMVRGEPGEMIVLSLTGALARFAVDQPARLTGASAREGTRDLIRTSDGTVWLVHQDGLEPLESAAQPKIPGPVDVAGVARDGGLWVLGRERVRRWNEGRWLEEHEALDLLGTSPTCLLETSNRELLIGTAGQGVWRGTPGVSGWSCRRVQELISESILDLCQDHEGSVWAGTAGDGLLRLSPSRAVIVPIPGWESPVDLLSVTAGTSNDLWIGSVNAGLFHLSDQLVTRAELPPALDGVALSALFRMESGAIWLGTLGRGLWVWDGRDGTPLPGWPWTDGTVHCLYPSPSGAVWAGLSDGLAVWRSNDWARVEDPGVILRDDIRCLAEDARGDLWFGTAGAGLGRLSDQGVTRFDRADGLGSSTVYALLADRDGTVWAGTQGGGLARVRDDRITTISGQQGLQHDTIGQIQDDGAGHLWLATLGGLVSAEKADLHRCADGELESVPAVLLGMHDGLSRVDFVCGNQPATARTTDHRLWFVAGKGLGVVRPDVVLKLRNRTPPPVVIEGLRANEREIPLPIPGSAERLRLEPGTDRLEIRYNALSYVDPRRVRFQYRLGGVDEDWVDAGPDRTVRFARLPPGDYSFQVRGCNNDGVWNEAGATLPFYLAPYIRQTLWFRLVLGLIGVGGVAAGAYALARVRHRGRLVRAEQEEALERERGRIARDMHDEVGAQLTRIAILSRLAQGKNTSDQKRSTLLRELNQTSRESMRRFDQIVWAVNPRNDTLQNFADYLANYAVAYFDQTGMGCSLNMPAELPEVPLSAVTRYNLLSACEEAMGNALRHSEATQVKVSITKESDRIRIRIFDNGKGFSGAMDAPGADGLHNLRKRLADIGGECHIQSAPNRGTTVHMMFRMTGEGSPT